MTITNRGATAPLLALCCGAALGALTLGCREAQPPAPAGGHDHEADEAPTLQVTVRSDRHELFLEYPVPSVEEPVDFLNHVTDHRSGLARTEGAITYRLRSEGGETIEHVEAAPIRPGIYDSEIVVKATGVWTVEVEIRSAEGVDRIALPPLDVVASHHAAMHVVVPDPPEGISFLKEQQWRLGTRLAPVAAAELVEQAVFPATVRALSDRRARVAPPVAGVLVAPPEGTRLRLGGAVEAGELLAYVRPPLTDFAVRLLEAEAAGERTRLAVELARVTRDRLAGLVEVRARSPRELEEAEFALCTAEVEAESAAAVAATLRRSGFVLPAEGEDSMLPLFPLRAPISGRLVEICATIGEFVDEDGTVVEILDSTRVLVEARLRPGDPARLGSLDSPILRSLRSPSGAPRVLEITEVELVARGLEADPGSQAVPLYYEVANASGELRIGTALEMLLPVGAPVTAPVVPLGALVDVDGEAVVYVQVGGETFEKRPVELGARDEARVQILAGLELGEWVVIEGAYALRLASASGGVGGHGHAH